MKLPDWDFSEWMMALICGPIVYTWLIVSIMLINAAFGDKYVLENFEMYKSVLAVLSVPAGMIVYKVMESWTETMKRKGEKVDKALVRKRDGSVVAKKIPPQVRKE